MASEFFSEFFQKVNFFGTSGDKHGTGSDPSLLSVQIRKLEERVDRVRAVSRRSMSHISTGALGLIAASLAFSGVQFGLASDGGAEGAAALRKNVSHHAVSVNRDAKADRGSVAPAEADTVTLSFQVPGLKDGSVAMRLPTADAIRLRPVRNNAKATNGPRRKMLACEPVVSVLTEVAKQLEPGRCIT